MKDIIIRGAREHNLKNINVTLPRDKFIVITGVSGSGKSTLAFNTLYAEGQRRYVESLSAYARQFLGVMTKPDVDSIDGLSPAISIEQKTTSNNPRSTVGTVTEIYDYLRLLYARIGIPHCPEHHVPIQSQSAQTIAARISAELTGQHVTILAPIIRQKKGSYEQLIKDLGKEGFVRVRVNGAFLRTDEKIVLTRYQMHDIEAVIDRVPASDLSRITEATEQALKKGEGLVIAMGEKDKKDHLYSSVMACPVCGRSVEELQPRMFSFNSPFGACEDCKGLGVKIEFDPDLLIPDRSKSIMDGAIALYGRLDLTWRARQMQQVRRFDLFTPVAEFTPAQLQALLYGGGDWEGLIPQSDRLYKNTDSDWRRTEMEKYMSSTPCPTCHGKRLKDIVLAVTVHDKSIMDVTDMSVTSSLAFFEKIELTKKELEIAKLILKELVARLHFLADVGLGYLTLSRQAGTLSGGEAQRIRLATQIGSNLMGVLYILDEPSIGLHQKDNLKLIETLHRLRDLGNTLVVVEHDEDTIRRADYVVDMGPGAGIHGGEVIAEGTPAQIMKNPKSVTGDYLSGKLYIPIPEKRRKSTGEIVFKNCTAHNLKGIDVHVPTGVLTCLTGVSGSGKSTLLEIIETKAVEAAKGEIDKVIVIDQSPIGRTPRSNPATYIKVFDEIRNLFAATREAKIKGYGPGRFSFNVSGGRCEKCEGDGTIKIEMNFLPDVYVECEECHGKRYNHETLSILYKGKSIADILQMSVEEARTLFSAVPSIERKLATLSVVGLGYIKVGQSALTLSGGEAQRVKLTKELAKRGTGKTLYLLDEPTTGLHVHDIAKLLEVMNGLVDKGNSIVVIEHNLEVIKSADHLIDLGPDGGDAGGEIIAEGAPEQVAKNKKSYTGQFLAPILKKN